MSTTLPSKRDFLATGLTPIPDTHSTGSCPLCHKSITDTVAIPCSNQHAFCKSCIIVWTTVNKKCPVDGEVLYQGPDRRTNVFYLLEITIFDDGGGANAGQTGSGQEPRGRGNAGGGDPERGRRRGE
ncbi:hypothetical protein CB0940_00224 [Cercospora beticola]|uniref:RING-type domain-containing protein n=1 Tax=Cercospora beticola TaxID=122368 RepID=A0A2G5I9X0_CERBT|nr:hypothetical protein CB0940_00224 [Cercospora beticola]PIB01585.1 hypothetical protein CB0940_00224 [Cercospora beticola]WPA95629.1 hypothetical protein RHO25_000231 [Cercospora beticola]